MSEDFLRRFWARRDTRGRPVLPGKSQDIVKILPMLGRTALACRTGAGTTSPDFSLHLPRALGERVANLLDLTSWRALVPSEPHQNPAGSLC